MLPIPCQTELDEKLLCTFPFPVVVIILIITFCVQILANLLDELQAFWACMNSDCFLSQDVTFALLFSPICEKE